MGKEVVSVKISRAFARAFRAYGKSPVATLKFLIIELCFILAALTPMLFLWSGVPALALLTIPAMILLVFPARMNAAGAMADSLEGGSLCSLRLIATAGYGKKLVYALKRLAFILLWAIPLIVFCVFAWNKFAGETDAFTLLSEIRTFGGGGKEGIVNGVLYLALILLSSLLVLMIGCGFHSGARHALAQGNPALIRGYHGKNLLCWICANITFLPLILAVVIAVSRYLPLLTDLNKTINGILKGSVQLPGTKTTVMILAMGAVLTVPFLPLRSLISAAFADGLKKQ